MKKFLAIFLILISSVCSASPKFGIEYTADEIDILLASINYAYVTSNDLLTDVTGTELETLTDGSDASVLHTHTEADPVYAAWIAGPPNISEFTNDSGFLTVANALWTRAGTALSPTTADDSIYTTGYASIGRALGGGGRLHVKHEPTAIIGGDYGIYTDVIWEPSANLAGDTTVFGALLQSHWNSARDGSALGYLYGVHADAHVDVVSGNLKSAIGTWGRVRHRGVGTITNAIGVKGDVRNDDDGSESGNITSAYSFLAAGETDKTTGTIGTRYGLYIEDVTGGGNLTNQYGIYCPALVAADTDNYFIKNISAPSDFGTGNIVTLGDVGIGTATPAKELHVASSGATMVVIEDTSVAGTTTPYLVLRDGIQAAADRNWGFQAGSDFHISKLNDDYTWNSNIFSVSRAGIVTLAGNLAMGGNNITGAGAISANGTITGGNLTTANALTASTALIGGTLSFSSGTIADTTNSIAFGASIFPQVSEGSDLGLAVTSYWRDLWLSRDAHIGTMTISGESISDSSGRISFNNENLSGTGTLAINIPSLYSTGDIKVQPNITGDVIFFGDTDVATAGTDGKKIKVYRKAAEGDAYFQINVDQYQQGNIAMLGGDFKFSGSAAIEFETSAGDIKFDPSRDLSLYLSEDAGTYQYEIYNGSNAIVASIDSLGNIMTKGTSTFGDAAADTHNIFGVTKIGDGGTNNFTQFSATGDIDLYGTANNIENHTGDLTIKSAGTLYLESVTEVVKTGGAASNCYSSLVGRVNGADQYVSWQVQDTTDTLQLTRSHADITKYEILMPVDIGDGTNKTVWSTTGDQVFEGTAGLVFGSCSCYEIGWTQVATQNTWYNVSDAAFIDGQLNNVTHDDEGELTVLKAGIYKVEVSCDWECNAANKHVEIGFEITNSGSAATEGILCCETKFANEEDSHSTTALLDLAANATIEMCVRTTDTGTPTIKVNCVSLNCVQIGG